MLSGTQRDIVRIMEIESKFSYNVTELKENTDAIIGMLNTTKLHQTSSVENQAAPDTRHREGWGG